MSEKAEVSSPAPPKRTTLKEFIDDNDKLLTAMGVMGALAALFTTVKDGQFLAFLAFAMLLVLDVELVHTFYKTRGGSETLIVFESLLEVFMVGIGEFMWMTYPTYFEYQFSAIIVGITLGWLSIKAYKRLKRGSSKTSKT
jgi:hypothetical protein